MDSTKPFVTQLKDARPTTKTRVLLRVKRRRQRPASPSATANCKLFDSATSCASNAANPTELPADDSDPIHSGGPVKKRKVSNTLAPEIIRLALPLPSPKRRKSCKEKEQLDLINRLSSAVSFYGDDTIANQAPNTPRRKEMEEENRIPPEQGRAVSHDSMGGGAEPPRTKTPVKPKRSVIFRKLTDLRKVLHPETATSATAEEKANASDDWDSKGEEKSKWLRVVDVKLHDSDDDTKEEGTGTRLQRMRSRPASDNGKDDAIDDCVERSGKRRKLGLVVERSCTVLESEFWTNSAANVHGAECNKLEEEVARLLDSSLSTLHTQGGGTVAPFLSSLKIDARLGFVSGTSRGGKIINHQFSGMDNESKGQTVLHFAAIWGDALGVRAALEMGADPTVKNAWGYTPAALARLNGHQDIVSTLDEAEARVQKCDKEDDFYYEVYCLEEENRSATETSELSGSAPSQVKVVNRNGNNNSPYASSFTTSESDTNESPPGLIRMDGHRMSEDEDDSCALMELRNGFGYWNEQGELILEAGGEQQSSAASSIDYQADDGRESCSEEDASIDYPDEQSYEDEEDDEIREKNSHGFDFDNLGSDYDDYLDADAAHGYHSGDDSSDDGWKMDFRNRFVPKSQQHDNIDSEDELSPGGFGINQRSRMHGWNYSGGMSDVESDDEYAGPMLG